MPKQLKVRHLEGRVFMDKRGANRLTTLVQRTVESLIREREAADEHLQHRYVTLLSTAILEHMGHHDVMKELNPPVATSVTAGGDNVDLFVAAAHVGDRQSLQKLLGEGADINTRSRYFGRALNAAASKGATDTVSLLLGRGADVSVGVAPIPTDYTRLQWTHGTALEAAARAGHEAIVHLIWERKYPTSASGHEYELAILQAAKGGHASLMQWMMRVGEIAEPTCLHEHIILEACERGHEETVHLMLDVGTNPNANDDSHRNVLQLAAARGSQNVVKRLLAKGADPNGAGTHVRDSPLDQAIAGQHSQVAQMLLDHGADINAGWHPPLHRAARRGHLDMVRFLLERGATLETESQTSDSCLAGAASGGYQDIVRILVERGANMGDSEFGPDNAAMQAALRYGRDDVVRLLIELGAKEVDPFSSRDAAEFASGKYPIRESYRGRIFH